MANKDKKNLHALREEYYQKQVLIERGRDFLEGSPRMKARLSSALSENQEGATRPSPTGDLIAPQEAALFLGLRWSSKPADRVHFYRAVHDWGIPHFKLGPKTIRFSRVDLKAWLENRRVGKSL